jgi:hypothetical protein
MPHSAKCVYAIMIINILSQSKPTNPLPTGRFVIILLYTAFLPSLTGTPPHDRERAALTLEVSCETGRPAPDAATKVFSAVVRRRGIVKACITIALGELFAATFCVRIRSLPLLWISQRDTGG